MKKHIVSDPLKYYICDRGAQYRSYDYQDLLEKFNILHSMSAPGTQQIIQSLNRSIGQLNVN